MSAPSTALVTSSAATSTVATAPAPVTTSADAPIPGLVVAQFWGHPRVEESGWLLVELTDGAMIDGATRVALYVPFAEVALCERADPDGYYKLVDTLPISFVAAPLVGGQVPYPESAATMAGGTAAQRCPGSSLSDVWRGRRRGVGRSARQVGDGRAAHLPVHALLAVDAGRG